MRTIGVIGLMLLTVGCDNERVSLEVDLARALAQRSVAIKKEEQTARELREMQSRVFDLELEVGRLEGRVMVISSERDAAEGRVANAFQLGRMDAELRKLEGRGGGR